MWTIGYKGYWIHGYTNKDCCRIQFGFDTFREMKSLHAAKCYISRLVKELQKYPSQ